VPEQHTALPTTVAQITANRYTNPGALADGGVLVVGSGASGSQIVEDLVETGRRVYLSVGRHRRLPRSYRSRDFCWWGQPMGRFSAVTHGVPEDYLAPLVTGVGGGHDVNLRALAERGVTLVGRLVDIEGSCCQFADDLEQNLAVGDDGYDDFVAAADALAQDPTSAEAVEPASACQSGPRAAMAPPPPALDLRALDISTVIRATGSTSTGSVVRCSTPTVFRAKSVASRPSRACTSSDSRSCIKSSRRTYGEWARTPPS
jgi:putative flavoprotein involved in K+ transport